MLTFLVHGGCFISIVGNILHDLITSQLNSVKICLQCAKRLQMILFAHNLQGISQEPN